LLNTESIIKRFPGCRGEKPAIGRSFFVQEGCWELYNLMFITITIFEKGLKLLIPCEIVEGMERGFVNNEEYCI